MFSLCLRRFPQSTRASPHRSWVIGECKLPIGVNVSFNGCLAFWVGLATHSQPVQGIPRILLYRTWAGACCLGDPLMYLLAGHISINSVCYYCKNNNNTYITYSNSCCLHHHHINMDIYMEMSHNDKEKEKINKRLGRYIGRNCENDCVHPGPLAVEQYKRNATQPQAVQWS